MNTTNDTSATAAAGPAFSEGLGAVRDRPRFLVFDRSETAAESVASDAATFVGLAACIALSHWLGGGMWQFVTLGMFVAWALCRMPWERATRTTLLRTKAEAKAWAESLPDDTAPNVRGVAPAAHRTTK